jgi:hypothetical protein
MTLHIMAFGQPLGGWCVTASLSAGDGDALLKGLRLLNSRKSLRNVMEVDPAGRSASIPRFGDPRTSMLPRMRFSI